MTAYRWTAGAAAALLTLSLLATRAPTPYGAARDELLRIEAVLQRTAALRDEAADRFLRGHGAAAGFAVARADGQPLDVSRLRFVDPSYGGAHDASRVETAVGAAARAGTLTVWRVNPEAVRRLVSLELQKRPTVVGVEEVFFQWGPPFGLWPTVRHRDGRSESQVWGSDPQAHPNEARGGALNPWGIYAVEGAGETLTLPDGPVAPMSPDGPSHIPQPLKAVWGDIAPLEPSAARAYLERRQAEQPAVLRIAGIDVPAVPGTLAAALMVGLAFVADQRRRRVRSVFICYASEDEAVGRKLALALRGEGHTVFFAPQALGGSDEYYRAIRDGIAQAEVFVFLLSAASVRPGCFTLSELAEAERKWKRPEGRVLTVALDGAAPATAPAYLQAVTIMIPAGDPVADATNRIAAMLAAIRRPLDLAFVGLAGGAVLAWGWLMWSW
jgi:hypothetical protein